jgi:hypothetical protein
MDAINGLDYSGRKLKKTQLTGMLAVLGGPTLIGGRAIKLKRN